MDYSIKKFGAPGGAAALKQPMGFEFISHSSEQHGLYPQPHGTQPRIDLAECILLPLIRRPVSENL